MLRQTEATAGQVSEHIAVNPRPVRSPWRAFSLPDLPPRSRRVSIRPNIIQPRSRRTGDGRGSQGAGGSSAKIRRGQSDVSQEQRRTCRRRRTCSSFRNRPRAERLGTRPCLAASAPRTHRGASAPGGRPAGRPRPHGPPTARDVASRGPSRVANQVRPRDHADAKARGPPPGPSGHACGRRAGPSRVASRRPPCRRWTACLEHPPAAPLFQHAATRRISRGHADPPARPRSAGGPVASRRPPLETRAGGTRHRAGARPPRSTDRAPARGREEMIEELRRPPGRRGGIRRPRP